MVPSGPFALRSSVSLQAPPGFWRFSGGLAFGGAAQGNAPTSDLVEEGEVEETSQEGGCSLPLMGREESREAAAASRDLEVGGLVVSSLPRACDNERRRRRRCRRGRGRGAF